MVRIGFNRYRAYANSKAGLDRAFIAEAEWNEYDYEDVMFWDHRRVQFYLAQMNATAKERDRLADIQEAEYREENGLDDLENEATGGAPSASSATNRPANLSKEEYENLPSNMKQRMAHGEATDKPTTTMIPEKHRDVDMVDVDGNPVE